MNEVTQHRWVNKHSVSQGLHEDMGRRHLFHRVSIVTSIFQRSSCHIPWLKMDKKTLDTRPSEGSWGRENLQGHLGGSHTECKCRHRREDRDQRTERVMAETETGDGMPLTLNVEAVLQKKSASRKRQEIDFSLEPPEGTFQTFQLWPFFFYFWPPDLEEKTGILTSASKCIAICHSRDRTRICVGIQLGNAQNRLGKAYSQQSLLACDSSPLADSISPGCCVCPKPCNKQKCLNNSPTPQGRILFHGLYLPQSLKIFQVL